MARHPVKDLYRLLADHLFYRLNETHLSTSRVSLYFDQLLVLVDEADFIFVCEKMPVCCKCGVRLSFSLLSFSIRRLFNATRDSMEKWLID